MHRRPARGVLQRIGLGLGNVPGVYSTTAINDNQWHVLTCVLTHSRVTAYVDGVEALKA